MTKRRNLLAPQLDFNREQRFKRPLIIPPGGSPEDKPIPYRRCTTYVGVVEDLYNLQQWEKRMVALGLIERDDLRLRVAAHRDDKGELNRVCQEAKDAGIIISGTNTAAGGTALHALTDMVDRGEELPPLEPGPAASIEAFRKATTAAGLIPKAIEMRTVNDVLEVAGTADRQYALGTGTKQRLYMGDTKSGQIELGILKIAMQIAVYVRSWAYNVKTGERWAHGSDFHRAIIMHMPQTADPAEAKCELYWVDIEAGWNEVRVARDTWRARKAKFKDLTEPFTPDLTPALIGSLIEKATTADQVRALYREYREHWTTEINEKAAARAKMLDRLPGKEARAS